MILYADTITSRLEYIAAFIGKEISGAPWRVTSDRSALAAHSAIINYSTDYSITGSYHIIPHGLLAESTIAPQEVDCFTINQYKAFFKTGGDHPFDIFAAAFYLISRYEEYLPYTKDLYGRYAHENSLAYREGFLDQPLVNQWLQDFRLLLEKRFDLPNYHPQFRFIPTYDIDEAYAYQHKGWWRTWGASVRNRLKGDKQTILERKQVLAGKKQDPFDAYAWMDELHATYKLEPYYFFLVPEKTGKLDRNILPRTEAMQSLIRQHAAKYKTGVHPSWQSGDDRSSLKKELDTLQQLTGQRPVISRQHFIRFTLPSTFRELIGAGIREDFSMGYGTVNGFRASVASPFYWYDLEKNAATSLLLHPFCYMEANSFFELKQTPLQALEELSYYYHAVKKVNGTLYTIWHNTFLGTAQRYSGWREVYAKFIEEIAG